LIVVRSGAVSSDPSMPRALPTAGL
jgi:hypothetical protein